MYDWDEDDDPELIARTENEIEIALMIVDALWNSPWIRCALQHYEYDGKGFHGYRQTFGLSPSNEKRPSIPAIKRRLEEAVLDKLRQIQYDIYCHPKEDKRTVTAHDLYKPNKRRMVTYGLDMDEISLNRNSLETFPRTPDGEAKCLAYLKAHGVNPENVIELGAV